MKKILLGILIGVVVLGLSGVAAAGLIPANEKARSNGKAGNAPVITDTGDDWALATPGLEKIVFIHYKKGFAKPSTECGNGICEPGENINKCPVDCGGTEPPEEESTCYAFLGKWMKWNKLPVNYVIDPANPYGLSESSITSAMSAGAEEWDFWTGAELFNNTYDIISDGSWDSDAPDGRNELLFGDYPQDGVIAVAIVWGYFTGPPGQRKITEFDILFDTDFTWGDATDPKTPNVMDLQNIATHELGHGVGLGDLYDTVCAEETMYGYSDYGDTKKRDLNVGDITGIQELYGGLKVSISQIQ